MFVSIFNFALKKTDDCNQKINYLLSLQNNCEIKRCSTAEYLKPPFQFSRICFFGQNLKKVMSCYC